MLESFVRYPHVQDGLLKMAKKYAVLKEVNIGVYKMARKEEMIRDWEGIPPNGKFLREVEEAAGNKTC